MHGSNLGLRIWALAIYLMATQLRGRSSMQLHRDLGVTQKTAWYLAHRIRENWEDQNDPYTPFKGPVEADESYFGGKRKFMHRSKREKLTGRGTAGKVAVAAVRDRETKRVSAQVVKRTDKKTLQTFVKDRIEPGAKVYTDEAHAYRGLLNHESVKHSVGEYVRAQAHTNGVESFWATMKRGFNGTYYRMSPKHLHRYVDEFAGRFNDRPYDTIDQMEMMVRGMEGKQLRYQDLVA